MSRGTKRSSPQYQLKLLQGTAHSLYLDIGEAIELENVQPLRQQIDVVGRCK